MSKHIQFSGPFIKQFYCKDTSTDQRTPDNPAAIAGVSDYAETIPNPLRRIYLFIQNNSASDVSLGFTTEGIIGTQSYITLAPKQSISFDNYNGPVLLSSLLEVHVFEAFA